MTHALNFTTKALESFAVGDRPGAPLSVTGMRYLSGKMREAQVFILPEYGAVLDRQKPRPEVPGLTFTPPFPVVALEYAVPADNASKTPFYTDSPASRRIALAWRWSNDLPPPLSRWTPRGLGDGVVIASIFFLDRLGKWIAAPAAAHLSFEAAWQHGEKTPFVEASLASGRISSKIATARTLPFNLVPLMPEPLAHIRNTMGETAMLDTLAADLMDEVNAYTDLCYALSCRNVGHERHSASDKLNKARIRKGAQPLKDFHILKLDGGEGGAGGAGFGAGRRGHLRRGHIRQLRYLGEGRMTWVNATMVKGRGFVEKAYSV